jgi:hypothetical protein
MSRIDGLLHEKLAKIAEQEEKLSHIEGHDARLAFITDVCLFCNYQDRSFNQLVQDQLDLICGIPDPRTFVKICNDPQHIIRNKMLSWYPDHIVKIANPEEQQDSWMYALPEERELPILGNLQVQNKGVK